MGNTPAHHKRRLSGDEFRFTGGTPTYLTVTVPPSKRRNMHSLTDLSRSAPADCSTDAPILSDPVAMAELLSSDNIAIDEATSMMRATSLREPIHPPPPSGSSTVQPTEPSALYIDKAQLRLSAPAATDPVTRHRDRVARESEHKCPTVFRWNGGGKDIYISGTFNNWEKRIPMVKRDSGVYVIIDCTPGTHEYKYFIDGAWYHDPTKPTVDNAMGTKNNIVQVKASDFDVIQALESDQAHSRRRSSQMEPSEPDLLGQSPPGEYGQFIPSQPSDVQCRSSAYEYRSSGPIAPAIGTMTQPPLLPPHLLQGILNMDTGIHCDPNLLPPPNHVIVNHLYALSIKDGVIVLSVITRYRQKFVSTVFYKPIQD